MRDDKGPRSSGCAGTAATRPYQIRPGARPALKSIGRPGGGMVKPLIRGSKTLTAVSAILVILAALLACGEQTPAPGGAEVTAPAPAGAATSAPSPVTPEPASTDALVSTQAPTERPTAAPKATPDSPPIPEPTANPVSLGVLAPLQALDSGAMLSELSDAEKGCIGENPERQTRFFGCLEDETVARIFLAGFVPGPRPLSQETSDCVRAAFEVINPREVMTAGIEGDPGRAMAGSMAGLSVTMACLTDQEWEATAPQVEMGPSEREGMRCLMAQLGGPGQMAAAMKAAQEGEFAELASAGAECGLEMGPPPGQPPGTPPPAPTATIEAPTLVSTPVTTGATPPGTPVATGVTPSGTPAITGATPVGTPVTTGATPVGTPAITGVTPVGTPAITGVTPVGTPATPTP